jgi:hypothetical protein
MSQLIVRIDEMLEDKMPRETGDVLAVLAKLQILTSPSDTGNDYARRYHTALQENPDAVLAHRDLITLLSCDR